jgi:Transglutaminase-like superfamily
MQKNFLNISGHNTDALSYISVNARRPLWVSTIAILITTLFAFYTGFEFVQTFTDNKYLPFVGGFVWSAVIFAFDYSIYVTPKATLLLKILRLTFGMSSNIVGSSLVIISINQAEINNQLILLDVGSVSKIDSIYQNEKTVRYTQVAASIQEEAAYHNQQCYPESQRNGSGPKYAKLHEHCMALQANRLPMQTQLDSNETAFANTHLLNRNAHATLAHNDYFTKLNQGVRIVKEDKMKIALSLFLLVIALVVEFWPLAIKSSEDKTLAYFKAKAEIEKLENEQLIDSINKSNDLKLIAKNTVHQSKVFTEQIKQDILKEQIELTALLEDGKAAIASELNFASGATMHKSNAEKYRALANSTIQSKSINDNEIDIFRCTKPMIKLINEIKFRSQSKADIINNVYDWCHANIAYPEDPRLESCFDACTTFNARSGVCIESAVLAIAFFRKLGLQADLYEVIVDMKGDSDINHAVAGVINEHGKLQLVDIAQHAEDAKHKEVKVLSDDELNFKFKIWNQ